VRLFHDTVATVCFINIVASIFNRTGIAYEHHLDLPTNNLQVDLNHD
jgi:hypothetical protein